MSQGYVYNQGNHSNEEDSERQYLTSYFLNAGEGCDGFANVYDLCVHMHKRLGVEFIISVVATTTTTTTI